MTIKPKWNNKTAKYEVIMFGKIHEFEVYEEALWYIDETLADYFSDPVYLEDDDETTCGE